MITPRRRKRDTFLPWIQLLVDCIAINVFLRAVFWFRFSNTFFDSGLGASDYPVYTKSFLLITLVILFFLRYNGLYQPTRFLSFSMEVWKVLVAVLESIVVLMAVTFFIRNFTFSRTFILMAGIGLALGISLVRLVLGLIVMWMDTKRGSFRNILIIGVDENAKRLVAYYKKNPRFSVRVIGFLDNHFPTGSLVEGIPVEGSLDILENYIKFHRELHEIVLAEQGVSTEEVLKIIYECEKQMVTFRWIADILGLIASKMSVSQMGGVSLLSFTDSPLLYWENRAFKRAMDILLSLVALILLSPLFILIAAFVKFDSRGPIFYGQQRIGEDGKRIILFKFRTMRMNAEKETGPVWATQNDPRRTKIGEMLRKLNLDELPQLWSVLVGDMSLVGPRPERPYFVSQFKEDIPRYMARHSIRSGITGWAQVNGLRGNTSIEERTKYDLYYIENWSLFLDIRILIMTLFAWKNAY